MLSGCHRCQRPAAYFSWMQSFAQTLLQAGAGDLRAGGSFFASVLPFLQGFAYGPLAVLTDGVHWPAAAMAFW